MAVLYSNDANDKNSLLQKETYGSFTLHGTGTWNGSGNGKMGMKPNPFPVPV